MKSRVVSALTSSRRDDVVVEHRHDGRPTRAAEQQTTIHRGRHRGLDRLRGRKTWPVRAGFGADDLGGRLGPFVGQLGGAQQDPHPLVGRRAPPGHRADLGAVQGGADIVRAGDRHRPGHRPVERRGHLLGAAARSRLPGAADKHLHMCTSLYVLGAVTGPDRSDALDTAGPGSPSQR
jgi:hypothetical protein